jgi:hypothetical protein
MEVDPQHLESMLETKLKMDGRRKTAFNYHRTASSKPVKGQDVLMMVIMALMGVMFMLILLFFQHSSSGLFLYLSMWMALLTLTLISDFTDVLIDVRDNYILLPRPVKGKTLAVSRILHVVFYLTRMTIPFSLPGLIGVGIKFGALPLLLFAFLIVLSVLMTIFMVNVLYLIMLNLLSPRKFKEVINVFQIVFYALTFLGYQILPRLVDAQLISEGNLLEKTYLWFLPSMWLASIWELWFYTPTHPFIYVLAAIGLVAPFVAIYLAGTILGRNFSQKMFSLGEGGNADGEKTLELKTAQYQQRQNQGWAALSGRWFCRQKLERSIYELTWKLTGRSRDFKLKFYPNLIMLPIYFLFIFVSPTFRENGGGLEALKNGSMYLFGFYFSMIILLSGLTMLQFSERYKASWFYRALPLTDPGLVLSGAFKAIVVKFYLPVYTLITFGSALFFGWHILDDALLAFFGILALVTGVALLTHHVLPFTKPWDEASRGGNLAFTLLTMMFAGVFGLFHSWVMQFDWAIWGLIPLCAWLYRVAIRQYGQTSWRHVTWE